jgi:hypothetical protein
MVREAQDGIPIVKPQKGVEKRIEFLQAQLNELDQYLPETYQFLMAELDAQKRVLMEIRVHQFYEDQSNEYQDSIALNRNQEKGKKPDHG